MIKCPNIVIGPSQVYFSTYYKTNNNHILVVNLKKRMLYLQHIKVKDIRTLLTVDISVSEFVSKY